MKNAIRKRVGIWGLSVAMLFAFATSASAASEIESNNTLATASVVNYGDGAGGFVNGSDTVDYWQVNNVPGGTHNLNGYSEMEMTVLSSAGSIIAVKPVGVYNVSFYTGSNGPIYVVVKYSKPGIYYYGYNIN